jgi:hypothetical protein
MIWTPRPLFQWMGVEEIRLTNNEYAEIQNNKANGTLGLGRVCVLFAETRKLCITAPNAGGLRAALRRSGLPNVTDLPDF